MPTILREAGYRFYFYSHEPNEPAHVHVDGSAGSAKFWLENLGLARNIGFSAGELAQLHRLVREHRTAFLEAWYGYFGNSR